MTEPHDQAVVIAVGDELLAGAHADLNTPEIARRLYAHGVKLRSARVVPDERGPIAAAVRGALEEVSLVFVTGGLGPTRDDVTREGVADAFGLELVESPGARAELESWFAYRDYPMPSANLRQALVPRGARKLANRVGTAPGFRIDMGDASVCVLPGPPFEMRTVLAEEALPGLAAEGRLPIALLERGFHLFGLSESLFAEMVGAWMDRDAEPRMGCSVKGGVLSVHLRGRDVSSLEERAAEFAERFQGWIFSTDEPDPERVLARELQARGISIALAESCTGGWAASLLAKVPGISSVLLEAAVTYTDEAKVRRLGVSAGTLEREGAVSRAVVEEMAAGLARESGARLTVAISGIAGPAGGSEEKPVGLVWFATCLDGKLEAEQRRFPAHARDWIRKLAARTALVLCLERVRAGSYDLH